MEKLKAKRRTRRRQNTVIINEATSALQGADIEQLSALLQRLEVNNAELRKVNEEIENCLSEDAFEEDYEEVVQSIGEVRGANSGLGQRAAAPLSPSPSDKELAGIPRQHCPLNGSSLTSWSGMMLDRSLGRLPTPFGTR
ncbi:hypothetical protein HPB50_016289 [Hyalomma asiaticum]|uniref:Uncharacterized protein n=1 Tax=Hyalomma asiaticum TaxID=266040 RepID=A0ACB7S6Z8_HYAAI|nr:hypothetical protein HPB50_016289 [Hyalomma asiaticum]